MQGFRTLALATILLSVGCHDAQRAGIAKRQSCIECALRDDIDFDALGYDTVAEAFVVFQEGCRDGDARSCSILGVMFQEGAGVTQDVDKARELFRFACLEGNRRACVSLGQMIETDARSDLAGAATLYEMACAKRDGDGCFHLGRVRVDTGDTVRGFVALEQSCQLGNADACGALAGMYRDGIGVKRNTKRARALYRRACARGNAAACETRL